MPEADTASPGRTLEDSIRDDLKEGGEVARAYLRQTWLSRAISTLGEARRAAGLTQAEVAERMGSSQSAVARWERDDIGSISLRRYVDFMLACDAFPMDVEYRPFETARALLFANPDTRCTADLCDSNLRSAEAPSPQQRVLEAAG